jgi:hypothetical protein
MNRIDQFFRLLDEEPTLFSKFQASRYMPESLSSDGKYAQKLRESFEWLEKYHASDWQEFLFRVSYEI